MRAPVPSSSWLKDTSRDLVAGVSLTGTVTSPKLMEPVQMAVGTGPPPRGNRSTRFAHGRGGDEIGRPGGDRGPRAVVDEPRQGPIPRRRPRKSRNRRLLR